MEGINQNQHAYLISGECEKTIRELKSSIEELFGVETVGNPDYRLSFFETLGIDEARKLKEEQGWRAFSGREKFFVVCADAITREAQNALLKVFEEPTDGTYIFLIVPSIRQILPTLLSRVRVVRPTTYNLQPTTFADAEEFLAAPVEKRLNIPFIKKLIEEKEKQSAISFFDELESVARRKLPAQKMAKADAEFFAEIIKCRGYAGDRASSVKMLLEYLSLITPVVK